MPRTSTNFSMVERSQPAEQPINQPFGSSPNPQTSLRIKSYSSNVIGKSMSLPDKLELLDSMRNGKLSVGSLTPRMSPSSTFGSPSSESPMINRNSLSTPIGSLSKQDLTCIDEGTGTVDESIGGSSVNEVNKMPLEIQMDSQGSNHPSSSDKARRALALSRVTKILDQNELENHSSQIFSSDSHNTTEKDQVKSRREIASPGYSPLIDRFTQPSAMPTTPSSSSSTVGMNDSASQVSYFPPLPYSFLVNLLPYPAITKSGHMHDVFELLLMYSCLIF